jgi:hypothetical protein
MKTKSFAANFFVLLLLCLGQSAWAQGQPVTFSATGDVPYGSSQVPVFQKQLDDHNRYSPSAFFVHVGDIFSDDESCTDSRYSGMATMLKGLKVPAYIVPGDNETVDCKDPAEGLGYWLKYFDQLEQNACGAPHTERQSERPENWAFTMDGVHFIGINLAGSSSHQPAADWVKQQLQAQTSQVRAAVVVAHYRPNYSASFGNQFRVAAAAFGKPILFLHGHGHSWVMDRPFPEQNVLRVQVDNGAGEPPVEITVTMDPAEMFTFKRNPWVGASPLNLPPCSNADPTFSINDVIIKEGDTGAAEAVFTVKLSKPLGQTATVDYQLADGTASAVDDYLAAAGTLTFPSGTTAQTIAVSVSGDLSDEPDETFFVNLTNATGAAIADAQGQGTILNDDGPKPPAAPSQLAATATGASTVDLHWNDNSSEENGFKIERKNNGGNFSQIATAGADAVSYQDAGLSPSATYIYRIRASNANGDSDFSNEATATTDNDGSDPTINVAQNKAIVASASYLGKPPENAVDGSTQTYWRSLGIGKSNPIAWLHVDLGAEQTLGRVVIRWKDSYYAKSYELQISTDELNWTVVYTTTKGTSKVQNLNFTPAPARYLRLYLKKNNQGTYRLVEFEVYSGPAPKAAKKSAGMSSSESAAISAEDTPHGAVAGNEVFLGQNHPNPFNPTTSMTYALPAAMQVKLLVYNLTGQVVATLVDGYQKAGSHEVIFEASHLPSGSYFAVLQAGGEKRIRRVVLMK